MADSAKILITGPDINKEGGVANYFSIVLPLLAGKADYFTVGEREGEANECLVKRVYRTLKDYLDFWRMVRHSGYDLVHINPSMVAASIFRDAVLHQLALYAGCKTLVFYRGWVEQFAVQFSKLQWSWFRRSLFRSEASIVLADDFQDRLKHWGYKSPIFIETTLVDEWISDGLSVEYLKQKWNRADFQPRILFLSRLVKEKGLFETIETCRILRQSFGGLELHIAGNGAALAEATAIASAEEWIYYHGYLRDADKQQIYREMDLYCLPTYGEGMPNSLLEAMACGLPILTRPVGGLKTNFKPPKMGILTESLDPRELAGLLENLLSDRARCAEIAVHNFEYARQHYLARARVKRLEDIYNHILDGTINTCNPGKS